MPTAAVPTAAAVAAANVPRSGMDRDERDDADAADAATAAAVHGVAAAVERAPRSAPPCNEEPPIAAEVARADAAALEDAFPDSSYTPSPPSLCDGDRESAMGASLSSPHAMLSCRRMAAARRDAAAAADAAEDAAAAAAAATEARVGVATFVDTEAAASAAATWTSPTSSPGEAVAAVAAIAAAAVAALLLLALAKDSGESAQSGSSPWATEGVLALVLLAAAVLPLLEISRVLLPVAVLPRAGARKDDGAGSDDEDNAPDSPAPPLGVEELTVSDAASAACTDVEVDRELSNCCATDVEVALPRATSLLPKTAGKAVPAARR